MIPNNKTARFVTQKIGSLLVAAVFSGTAFVLYQTFWPHSNPLHIEAQNAEVFRDSTGIILTWDCKSYARRKINGFSMRWLINTSSGQVMQLPATEITMEPGKYEPRAKSVILPSMLNAGEWCLKSVIKYYDFGSLKESSMPGLNICFEVPSLNLADHSEIARRIDELEKILQSHTKADFDQHAELLKGTKVE